MSLSSMKNRLNYYGGANQQDRMVRDKARSLDAAIERSYQAARFIKENSDVIWHGLFNPDIQTENYDTKIISIHHEAEIKPGTVFRWDNTSSYWICFLQTMTELAYFRGDCRRCDYEIAWINKDRKEIRTKAAIIGPTVPSMRTSSSMQAKVAQDFPNANLVVLVSDNEDNRAFFDRYQKFLVKGISYLVEEVDNISMPGVIQIMATEHYNNLIEDDVEENIRNVWNVVPIIEEHLTDYAIEGPQSIKPRFKAVFEVPFNGGEWVVIENLEGANLPITFISLKTDKRMELYWDSILSGNFTLGYKTSNGQLYQRNIIVESLM